MSAGRKGVRGSRAASRAVYIPAMSMIGMRRARIGIGIVVVGLVAGWLTWPRTTEIEIDRGGAPYLVGRWSRTPLGDTIFIDADAGGHVRIANHDTITHQLGLFRVDPDATREYVISQRGVYTAYCSVHPTGQLTYIVR